MTSLTTVTRGTATATLLLASNDQMLARHITPERRVALWVADPPWTYSQTGGGDAAVFRSTVKRLYALQGWKEIAHTLALASECTIDDGLLALWVTTPLKLEIARYVVAPLEDWGCWNYATSLYWQKTGAPGMGQWIRNDVEELWILARKSSGGAGRIPVRLKAHMQKRCDRNHFACARHELEHSEKPEKLEQLVIERFTTPTDLVGSLWAGLFVTGRAALETGRDCIGAEIDGPRHEQSMKLLGKV